MSTQVAPAPVEGARFAYVFKTYEWDDYVARQFERFRAAVPQGDVFISVDETNAQLEIPWHRVSRTSNAKLVASGLANRYEKGSLIWWNADYAHHDFFASHPDYDYYVFAEYDVVIQADLAGCVQAAASRGADFVASPLKVPMSQWFWADLHEKAYRMSEMRGSINCLTFLSNRAMSLLRDRRMAMSRQEGLGYWPLSEVFMATEISRAGYVFAPLSDFGDVARFEPFPPLLEEDLPLLSANGFLHPVLDRPRFKRSLLRSGTKFMHYLLPQSPLRRSLARFPRAEYLPLLRAAALRRLRELMADRIERGLARASGLFRRRLEMTAAKSAASSS